MTKNYTSLAAIILLVGVLAWWATESPWTSLRTASLIVGIPGFIGLVLARIELGRSFSVRAQATALVTTGIYSRIRNPIYVFGSMFMAGIMLFFGKPWLLLLFVVLAPMQIRRAREEARVLHAAFGEEYERYRAQTWF